MFLLNNNQILDLQLDENQRTLRIGNFSKSQLEHSSYRFRLSKYYAPRTLESWNTMSEENPILELKPGDYYRVLSLETFSLSDKILGIFGPPSDMVKLGLRLVHGPFIDPLFGDNLPLELGLHNPLQETIVVNWRMTLGKVSFFNIADTYPLRKVHKSSFVEKIDHRTKLRSQGLPEYIDDDDSVDYLREQESNDHD